MSGPGPTIRVRQLPHAAGLPLPEPASAGSAGVDLRAAVDADWVLEPGARAAIPTGLCLEIPAGWEGQVRPRSGLALRHGLTLLNAPGTIDSDYRGELLVILANLGQEPFVVRRGERIAQLIVAAVATARFATAEDLSPTSRGPGGFGSTGRS